MRKLVKNLVLLPQRVLLWLLRGYSRFVRAVSEEAASYWVDDTVARSERAMAKVIHAGKQRNVTFTFTVPNRMCRYRARTFSEKEPETLEWIDEFGGEGTFVDVGANIGLYSIYYAKTQPGSVVAFEPSVFNLPLLVRNMNANDVTEKIMVNPAPLSDSTRVADFLLSHAEQGGAQSAFGVTYGTDGEELPVRFRYQTLGTTLDDYFADEASLQQVSMIKIDVDGIEHLILKGAQRVLMSQRVRSVLVEVNEQFVDQAQGVESYLSQCGFIKRDSRQSAIIAAGRHRHTFNQIWIR